MATAVRRTRGDSETVVQTQKALVFLYPQPEIIDFEIEVGAVFLKDRRWEREYLKRFEAAGSEEEKAAIRAEAREERERRYRDWYRSTLNACIDSRYRSRGFTIFFALLDNSRISDVIDVHPGDRIIFVGIDAETHRTRGPDGKFPYPDQNELLNQLGQISTLRVAGFHMWDCVDKLAKTAYGRGLVVLEDEDLTEFFQDKASDRDFRIDSFPTYNPRRGGKLGFELFLEARRDKPWLWQDYE